MPLQGHVTSGAWCHEARIVVLEQGAHRLGVEVVGVGVSVEDQANPANVSGIDRDLVHPMVGKTRTGVLHGEAVGQVGVDQQRPAGVADREAGLTQPPTGRAGGGAGRTQAGHRNIAEVDAVQSLGLERATRNQVLRRGDRGHAALPSLTN